MRTPITVRLPTDLVAELSLRLADHRGRVRYGALQKLFEALLRAHLQKTTQLEPQQNDS